VESSHDRCRPADAKGKRRAQEHDERSEAKRLCFEQRKVSAIQTQQLVSHQLTQPTQAKAPGQVMAAAERKPLPARVLSHASAQTPEVESDLVQKHTQAVLDADNAYGDADRQHTLAQSQVKAMRQRLAEQQGQVKDARSKLEKAESELVQMEDEAMKLDLVVASARRRRAEAALEKTYLVKQKAERKEHLKKLIIKLE